MISLASVRAAAKRIAQDGPGDGTGQSLLVTDPDDYTVAVRQALPIFQQDRPNVRVVDVTVASSGFLFPLSGAGAVLDQDEDASLNAWAEDDSLIEAVWWPYAAADQGVQALDANFYRTRRTPTGEALEFVDTRPATGEIIRLEFTRPHQLTEAPNTVDAPTAPTLALVAAAGLITNGAHSWAASYLTEQGETVPGAVAALTVTNNAAAGKVSVTIPATDLTGVIGAKVYRTVAAGSALKLVGTVVQDMVSPATFVDNVADGALGAAAPTANTAGGLNSVRTSDGTALALLVASLILQLAANKAVQNTGNSGLPNDIVDRRSQSDQYRSRSKELRDVYKQIVGKGDPGDLTPAGAFLDLDVQGAYGRPLLWHPSGSR